MLSCKGYPSQLARAVKELKLPFIASGGVADARGFAAALALGAAVSCSFSRRFVTIALSDSIVVGRQHGYDFNTLVESLNPC